MLLRVELPLVDLITEVERHVESLEERIHVASGSLVGKTYKVLFDLVHSPKIRHYQYEIIIYGSYWG